MSRQSNPRRPARLGLGLVAALLVVAEARAEIKLPAVFGPGMVLQRDQKDKVWGKAEPGEAIKVAIAGQEKATIAGPDGVWTVRLDPMPAGGPFSLTISGKKETVVFDDVLIGEVWLCSGQSNMEWRVASAVDGDLEALTAKYPQIRFLTVPRLGTQEPQHDFKGKWQACTPETARGFSAVGYFFGRQIHQTLGVPVGLIDDSWGGSAAEAWVRRDRLDADPHFKDLMARWAKIEADAATPKAKADDQAKRDAYRAAVAKAKEEKKPAPRSPQFLDAMLGCNYRPANIYNGMLRPTIGYGIRGVLWYQGESNANMAYQYRDLFPLLIQSWRDEWEIGDFPFYWVQLADYEAEAANPGESAWAELREAQTMTLNRLPKTGQAVIIDLGEGRDIHPKNKQDVAKRLARLALANDYGVKVSAASPKFSKLEIKGDKAVLEFTADGGGLRAFDTEEVRGFAVAGVDKKFVKAKARLIGPKTVEVSAEGVSAPVAVRYAWASNPVCNLYSNDGLPVTPFRTDDWPGVTANRR